MFAVCKKTDLPLFESTLCAECWTLQYYKSSQYILHDQDICDDENSFHVSMVAQKVQCSLSMKSSESRTVLHRN